MQLIHEGARKKFTLGICVCTHDNDKANMENVHSW